MAVVVQNLDIKLASTGLNVLATWSPPENSKDADHTKEYSVKWYYYKDGTWFGPASTSTAEKGTRSATYSYDENTKKVKVVVTPVSKEYTEKVKSGKTTKEVTKTYFTGTAAKAILDVPSENPADAKKANVPKRNAPVASWQSTTGSTHVVTWTDSEDKKTLASYDYEWRYYDGTVWHSETGSSPKDIKKVSYTSPEGATKVKFSVTPVPIDSSSWVGQASPWITKDVFLEGRGISNLTVERLPNTDRTVIATWTVDDVSDVGSFEYQWKYWISSANAWSQLTTGTVDVSSRSTENDVKKSKWEWSTTFDIPDGYYTVQVRVRPLPKTDGAFNGNYSSFVELRAKPESKSVDDLKVYIKPGTARTLLAVWGITGGKDERLKIANYEYQWFYKIKGSSLWFDGSSGSVTREGHTDNWTCEFTTESNCTSVRVRVKPIPTKELDFTPEWTNFAQYDFNIPQKQLTGLTITRLGTTGRNLTASWDGGYTTNTDHYEYQWMYYAYGMWFDSNSGTATVEAKNTGTYTAPAEADEVKVRVIPVPKLETQFSGVWTNYVSYKFTSEPITISSLTLTKVPKSSRTLLATWAPKRTEWLTSYTLETSYYTAEGVWTGTSETSVDKSTPNLYFDADERAKILRVRVRPDYESDCGYIGNYSGYAYYSFVIPTRDVTNVAIQLERGSERTLIGTWSLSNLSEVESFEYEWRYMAQNIWFSGGSGSADPETPSCTYDAPASATLAELRVRAVPQYETSFTGDWSKYVIFTIPENNTPETPNVPTVTIDKTNLVMSVDTYDEKTTAIEFSVKNETGVIIWTGKANVVLNKATSSITVAAGHTYNARARGVNKNGEFSVDYSQWSADILSLPAAIVGEITCVAASDKSVTLTWNRVESATEYDIEYTRKRIYFDAAPSMVSTQTVSQVGNSAKTTAIITDLESGVEWFFRVRAKNSQGTSEWSNPVSALIGTTPDAPTTWSSTTTAMVDRDIYLYWVHNSEDNSQEVSAELALIVNGVSSTITINRDPTSTDVSSYKIAAGTYNIGAKIQWKVRTKGVMPDYGAWSTQRVIDIYAPPTLSLVLSSGENWIWDNFNFSSDTIYTTYGSPIALAGGTLTSFPLMVYLSAAPVAQTPISYILTITANSSYESYDETGTTRKIVVGQEVYRRNIYTNEREFMIGISASDVDLVSGESYIISATVAMDSGLSADASVSFGTNFGDMSNYILNAEMTFDSEPVILHIRPYCLHPSEANADDMSVSLYRREFDGGFTLIGDNLDGYTTVTDPHPSLNYARYRIVARSISTGQIIFEDLPGYPIEETSIIIQWDEEYSQYDITDTLDVGLLEEPAWNGSMLRLPYNVDTADSNTIDSELINYIGRKHPVSYYGTQVGQTFNWNTDIARTDVETIYLLRKLAVYMGDVYVREPSGVGCWAQVQVSFDSKHGDTVIPVSLSITRVEGGA